MARNVEFDEAAAIQKAMEVFWKKGYNATSLRDLTDAMKINSSSLYNTIGDKQELFVRCVQHYTDIRKEDWDKRLSSERSPLAILKDYIHEAVNIIINCEDSCMAVKSAFEVATNDERVKKILAADDQRSYQFLHNLIKKAMDKGEIRDDEDPALLADYFNSIWTGWYESFILHGDPIKIKRMAEYFIKQLTK
ncbi:TetR/AcrR family transcriptional regulator [Mucilaginibacter achroorhodeus]|uniref:TetR/AcrR family transcriptional regulator n=1 Tax=Mucilaginibacter achroorhodeus TaxID=2599294 RepID=A0A563U2C2_9SPHI|nr:TetR/AcrR family transcriptional regulator [Mucilaginibacter achroorhodeus]TWR25441.1 TetR/AcrR family transcriptional regulator [Mucilaginibacter achroorhodeus]